MSTQYFFHRICSPSPAGLTESIMLSMFLKQDSKYNWLKQQTQCVLLLEACPVPQNTSTKSYFHKMRNIQKVIFCKKPN